MAAHKAATPHSWHSHQIGKKPANDTPAVADDPDRPWVPLKDERTFTSFFARHTAAGDGYVVGGTAWDFASARKLPEGGYDLLVVDEAGQFALANTLAVARAARNVMLLGDPQQALPEATLRDVLPMNGATAVAQWLLANAHRFDWAPHQGFDMGAD